MNKKKYLYNFLIWRLSLLLIAVMAIFFLPFRPGYSLQTGNFSFANLATMWANFDGLHYLSLAQNGYKNLHTTSQYAFFPVYPFLVRTFSFLGSNLAGALVISHLFFILGLLVFYRLVLLDFNKAIAKKTIFLILIFPTSFFFGSVNSEAVFFFLVVSSLFLIRKNWYLPAVILAAIASATRLAGIFLWPALLIELWQVNKGNFKKTLTDPRSILMLLPPLGLLSFMRYQFLHTGSWITFITSQPAFGANRVVNKLILLHQVFYRYFRMLVSLKPFADPIYFTIILELLISSIFLILVFYAFKKTRLSYAVFALLSFIVPTFTGTFSSMPRYVLTVFPAFMVLALFFNQASKKYQKIYIVISLILAVISVSLFTRGYFIA